MNSSVLIEYYISTAMVNRCKFSLTWNGRLSKDETANSEIRPPTSLDALAPSSSDQRDREFPYSLQCVELRNLEPTCPDHYHQSTSLVAGPISPKG
jgi:hypothetical protein